MGETENRLYWLGLPAGAWGTQSLVEQVSPGWVCLAGEKIPGSDKMYNHCWGFMWEKYWSLLWYLHLFQMLTLEFAVRLLRHWSQPGVFLKVFLSSSLPPFLLSFQKRSVRTWIVCQSPSLTEQGTWVWGAIKFLRADSRITELTLRKGFSKPTELAPIPFCHERSPGRYFQEWELVSELSWVLSC